MSRWGSQTTQPAAVRGCRRARSAWLLICCEGPAFVRSRPHTCACCPPTPPTSMLSVWMSWGLTVMDSAMSTAQLLPMPSHTPHSSTAPLCRREMTRQVRMLMHRVASASEGSSCRAQRVPATHPCTHPSAPPKPEHPPGSTCRWRPAGWGSRHLRGQQTCQCHHTLRRHPARQRCSRRRQRPAQRQRGSRRRGG